MRGDSLEFDETMSDDRKPQSSDANTRELRRALSTLCLPTRCVTHHADA
jgi:hypothetical protein